MTSQKRKLISSLIKKYSYDNGTESLIGYVAETNGMIGACKEMFGFAGDIDPNEKSWIRQECDQFCVSFQNLSASVIQVLAIFDTSEEGSDHYVTLGLENDASLEEVKTAYRKLCLVYHPDRATADREYDSKKFIDINKAYHAITEPEKHLEQNGRVLSQPDWNRTKKKNISSNQKKVLTYWGMGLLFVLIIVCVIGTINVRKRAMLSGLTEKRDAFIPPPRKIVTESSKEGVSLQPEYVNPDKVVTKSNINLREDAGKQEKIISKEVQNSSSKNKDEDVEDITMDGSYRNEKTVTAPATSKVIMTGEAVKIKKGLAEPSQRQKNKKFVVIEAQKKEKKQSGSSISNPAFANQIDEDKDFIMQTSITENPLKAPSFENSTETKDTTVTDSRIKSEMLEAQGEVTKERIDNFIDKYEKAYAKRNIITFSRFFQPDAIENDKLFTEMLPVYSELFKTTSEVSIDVNILFWETINDKIYLEGRYTVALQYRNGNNRLGTGEIMFILSDDGGTLRVQSLTYKFDKSS